MQESPRSTARPYAHAYLKDPNVLTTMAPVTASSKKKGFLLAMAEEGEKAVSMLLHRKHKSTITNRRTRKGEATRERGLRKIVNRGVSAAMSAYGMAKKTGMLGGVQGVFADAVVKTSGALLGIQSTQAVGTSIAAGWNLKCEAVREGDRRSLSLSFNKTPQDCERREFKSRLEFESPVNNFIRVPGEAEHRRGEGNSIHSPFIEPKTEPDKYLEFETIPLMSPQGAEGEDQTRGSISEGGRRKWSVWNSVKREEGKS